MSDVHNELPAEVPIQRNDPDDHPRREFLIRNGLRLLFGGAVLGTGIYVADRVQYGNRPYWKEGYIDMQ